MRVRKLSLIMIAFFILIPLSAGPVSAQPRPVQGIFSRVPGRQFRFNGKTVEVTEFMSFYCGHCYAFERSIPVIKGNFPRRIKWRIVPIFWGNGSSKPSEAYLLAEEAGKGEQMKKALFHAFFAENKDIGRVDVLDGLAADIGLGFDFSMKLRSGEKAAEVRRDLAMARAYGVDSTPTIIIAGDLKVDPGMTRGDMDVFQDNAINIIKSLLKR